MTKRKLNYRPPVNVVHVSIYLTPAQRDKAARMAAAQSARESEQLGRPVAVSVAQYIRTLIDRDPEQTASAPMPSPPVQAIAELIQQPAPAHKLPAPVPASALAGTMRNRRPRATSANKPIPEVKS